MSGTSILRPFSTRKATEIIAAPKVYAFDTGFVCDYRGWHELRQSDLGVLWEHVVLNEIMAAFKRFGDNIRQATTSSLLTTSIDRSREHSVRFQSDSRA